LKEECPPLIVTRTASVHHREPVRLGSPAARLDADEEYACDTVRDDADESAHGCIVDIELEIDADFQVDIDISRYE
jgi:hypothetical protein